MENLQKDSDFDRETHHREAVRAAEESMVLLKNEGGILPLSKEDTAVIGAFAQTPRFQGAGSSKVNPFVVDTPLEKLKEAGIEFEYSQGFSLNNVYDEKLLNEAVENAGRHKTAVIFAGLPENRESEGFDRPDMGLPDVQNRLIEEVCKVNPNVVVVLMCGAPVELTWEDRVKGILLAYLSGEGGAGAIARILTGQVSPSGKLAETWPVTAADAPSADNFPGDRLHVLYKETVYIGYRYYETLGKRVNFPFGHGLSYTSFAYSCDERKIPVKFGEKFSVTFMVENRGEVFGKETSFVFLKNENSKVYRPKFELLAFTKNGFEPGEKKNITVTVDSINLGYYNIYEKAFYAPGGEYSILIGPSMEELMPVATVVLSSKEAKEPKTPANDFETLLLRPLPLPASPAKRPFTRENCLEDVKDTFVGKILIKMIKKYVGNTDDKESEQGMMIDSALMEMSFYGLMKSSNGALSKQMMYALIELLNGRYIKGIAQCIKALKKK